MKVEWQMLINTISEMNSTEHFLVKAKRHKSQQFFTRMAFNHYCKEVKLPCEVKLIRLGSKFLDDDNLPCSMKYVRDELAECLIPASGGFYRTKKGKTRAIKGKADNDPRIAWKYDQQISKLKGVRVEISY